MALARPTTNLVVALSMLSTICRLGPIAVPARRPPIRAARFYLPSAMRQYPRCSTVIQRAEHRHDLTSRTSRHTAARTLPRAVRPIRSARCAGPDGLSLLLAGQIEAFDTYRFQGGTHC